MEVEVIVGEKDFPKGFEVMRFVLLEPQDFRGGVPGEDGVSLLFQEVFCAAEDAVEFVTFGDGGRVAPEFCGADDVIICVEGDEAVLLATDADCADLVFSGAEF